MKNDLSKEARYCYDARGNIHFVNPADCVSFSKKLGTLANLIFIAVIAGLIIVGVYVLANIHKLGDRWIRRNIQPSDYTRFKLDRDNDSVND